MNKNDNTSGHTLDRAMAELRETPISAGEVEEVTARVLDRLKNEHRKVASFPTAVAANTGASGHIAGCEGFRVLIPAYLAGALAPERTLLLEDHSRECVGCRKAVERARHGGARPDDANPVPLPSEKARRFRFAAIAAAAGIVIAGFLGWNVIQTVLWPVEAHAMAQTVNGALYLVAGQNAHAIAAGSRIERGQAVRSGSGSSAILVLADGARIEMGARSELALAEGRDGITVRLRRGSVIVTAEPQNGRQLYVETPDIEVLAIKTLFAVSAVPRGSRVSVIEGEAKVLRDGAATVLASGQQFATDASMQTVSVRDEIAWSPGTVARAELAGALMGFREDMRRRLSGMGMRFDSDLKGMIPAGSVVVASLPNVSAPFGEAYASFKQRVQEAGPLREWWAANSGTSRHIDPDAMVGRLARIGAHLGPEIVLAFPAPGQNEYPLAIAGLKDGDRAWSMIQDQLEHWSAGENPGMAKISVARNAADLEAAAARSGGQPVIYLDRRWIAVSSPKQIQRIAAFRANPVLNPFLASPLGKRIDHAYGEGVGWLLAADLKQMVERAPRGAGAMLGWLGMDDADQLLVEQKTGDAGAEYRATLGFSRERHGVAAWIGEPAPMGGLEFVSPGAYSAAAVVTRDPALILDDLFALVGSNAKGAEALDTYQRNHQVDIRNDLAAPLGNEFLIALDGPILPTPAWRGVIEINDAARLQNTIENTIAISNREGVPGKAASLSSEVVDGRTFYRLSVGNLPVEIHYAFWGGYMVLAPKRAFVMEAIATHDSGNSLARAPAFRSQLPAGRDAASAFFYQNFQDLAGQLPAKELSQSIVGTGPSAVYLFGEPDRIIFSGRGVMGMNAAGFAGPGAWAFGSILGKGEGLSLDRVKGVRQSGQ